ncbi:PLD nuclease N-terminal domain-containing protein [Nocardiopsis coralliicola]
MWWLAGLMTLLTIVVCVYAFFDALTTPAADVRTLPKVLWLIAIVAFVPVGPVLWLLLGRPRAAATAGPGPADPGVPDDIDPEQLRPSGGSSAPKGPDDDPDFLRDLDKRIKPDEE